MSRWGEEEKPTKGLMGCFFAFSLMALFGYFAYVAYPSISKRQAFANEVERTLQNAFGKTAEQLELEVLAISNRLNFPVLPENIEITVERSPDNVPTVNSIIYVDLDIDMGFTQFTIPFNPIAHQITLVRF
jgi:hypothetical protein